MTATLTELLAVGARSGASDVHITADAAPLMRVDGDLVPIPGHLDILTEAWVRDAAFELMNAGQRADFERHHEVDLAHAAEGIGRFRVNVFRQLGVIAMALRFIPDRVFTLEELGAPAIARDLALRPRGLVLLTGPTGSGKSTTLTAMVDIINSTRPVHIVTIEDPIEFHHTSRRALIHQREVGSDTNSFAEALRRVLRQDPDVILVGELRDPESIMTALSAAETGHLVLSTLHTQGAAKSVNRIVDVFPADQQHQIRTQLGDTLQGINRFLPQRLREVGRLLVHKGCQRIEPLPLRLALANGIRHDPLLVAPVRLRLAQKGPLELVRIDHQILPTMLPEHVSQDRALSGTGRAGKHDRAALLLDVRSGVPRFRN